MAVLSKVKTSTTGARFGALLFATGGLFEAYAITIYMNQNAQEDVDPDVRLIYQYYHNFHKFNY